MSVPYIPLYVADFEADTAHLSMEEDGAYNRLLRLCWRTPGCSVPDDPKWIMRKMRISADDFYRVVEPLIDEFFTRGMDRIFSPRLQQEHDRATALNRQKSVAGKASAAARARKSGALKTKDKPATAVASPLQQPELEPEPDVLGTDVPNNARARDTFSDFWEAYPRKVGKRAAENAWKAAAKRDGPSAIATGLSQHLPDLAAKNRAQPNFCPHPATWLNQGRYGDPPPQARRSVLDEIHREAEEQLNGLSDTSGHADTGTVRLSSQIRNAPALRH